MSEAPQTIIDFVDGRLDADQFSQLLYSNLDEFEAALSQDPDSAADSYAGRKLFYYILDKDYSDPGDVLDVHGALSSYLQRLNIPVRPTASYEELFEALIGAQPDWLDI